VEKKITDNDIVNWANNKNSEAGKSTRIRNFQDPSIKDSKFLLDLVDAVRSGSVDYNLVNNGGNEEELLLNAKYAVGVARKIGCCIFALPEDIVEVKSKMIMTFVATVMAVDKGH